MTGMRAVLIGFFLAVCGLAGSMSPTFFSGHTLLLWRHVAQSMLNRLFSFLRGHHGPLFSHRCASTFWTEGRDSFLRDCLQPFYTKGEEPFRLPIGFFLRGSIKNASTRRFGSSAPLFGSFSGFSLPSHLAAGFRGSPFLRALSTDGSINKVFASSLKVSDPFYLCGQSVITVTGLNFFDGREDPARHQRKNPLPLMVSGLATAIKDMISEALVKVRRGISHISERVADRISQHINAPFHILYFTAFLLTSAAQYPLQDVPYQAIYTANGTAIPCSGCFLYTYVAGTNTPLATYTSSTLGVAMPNPIRTNSAGYAVSESGAITGVWVSGSACYHLVFKNASAVTVWDQTPICNPAGAASTLQALLATAAGAGMIGFSQSSTYPAATVGKKLQQTVSITDAPYSANCNGSADTLAAWTAALSAVGSGGEVRIPPNVTCRVSASIVLPLYPINIGGSGRTSVISCTGVRCITATSSGQVIHDIGIQESNASGNVSTVGISIGDGVTSPNQITLRNVTLLGISANKKGIGVICQGATQVTLDNVISAFWNYGLELLTVAATPCNAVRVTNSSFIANAARQVSDTGGGDVWFIGNDIENGAVGIYQSAGFLTLLGNHFESGAVGGIDFECNAGSVINSSGNFYGGGIVKLDSGCTGFNSYGDYPADTFTLNNTGFNAQMYTPFLFSGTITGGATGSMAIWSQTGEACVGACSATNTYTFGFPYTSIPISSPVAITGTLSTTGAATIGGPLAVTTLSRAINLAVTCSGAGTGCSGASANNALVAKWTNPDGTLVSLAVGQMIYLTDPHTLQIGANTLNLNNTGTFPIHTLQKGTDLTSTWTNSRYYLVVAASEYFLIGAL